MMDARSVQWQCQGKGLAAQMGINLNEANVFVNCVAVVGLCLIQYMGDYQISDLN